MTRSQLMSAETPDEFGRIGLTPSVCAGAPQPESQVNYSLRPLPAAPARSNTENMTVASELSRIYERDLTRLIQELQSFPDDGSLWRSTEGMSNSPGNLALHLEGNLREFVGRQIGGIAYERKRELEFSSKDLPLQEVIQRLEAVKESIPRVVGSLTDEQLSAEFPQQVFKVPTSNREMLIHLLAHLSYHLGQIDAERRALAKQGAIELAGLAK